MLDGSTPLCQVAPRLRHLVPRLWESEPVRNWASLLTSARLAPWASNAPLSAAPGLARTTGCGWGVLGNTARQTGVASWESRHRAGGLVPAPTKTAPARTLGGRLWRVPCMGTNRSRKPGVGSVPDESRRSS
jgi:hypothetical protein